MRNDLADRLMKFAIRIVQLVETLPRTLAGRRIGDQLLRAGTSSGANYEEAQGGESKADFTHKLQISLKEMREANFWLRVLDGSGVKTGKEAKELIDESSQLKAILSKAVATAKGTAKDEPEN